MPSTLADFLAARHVCVVGATTSSFAGTIVQRNLALHGSGGRIAQVHPKHREVDRLGGSAVAIDVLARGGTP